MEVFTSRTTRSRQFPQVGRGVADGRGTGLLAENVGALPVLPWSASIRHHDRTFSIM